MDFIFDSVLILAAVFLSIQIVYLLFIFSRLAFYSEKQTIHKKDEPVSVILCARNELENLKRNLPLLLQQDYPDFEVIVVNDNSWDDTSDYLDELKMQYSNLKEVKFVEAEKYPKGKKFVLTLGIKAAKNEILLHTDADCTPASNQWIRLMQSKYKPSTHIVLGFSPYVKENTALNIFIRFETFLTGLQYLSFALLRMPYMGVGRNLSYRRSLFFAHKGFASHNHILSGDDDLFVNEAATANNTEIEIDRKAFTFTQGKKTFSQWWTQKCRHLSTGKYYKGQNKFLLGLFNSTQILFLFSLIFLLAQPHMYLEVIVLWSIRFFVQAIIYGFSMRKLGCTQLIFLIPLLDILYSIYYLAIGVRTLFIKNKTWTL